MAPCRLQPSPPLGTTYLAAGEPRPLTCWPRPFPGGHAPPRAPTRPAEKPLRLVRLLAPAAWVLPCESALARPEKFQPGLSWEQPYPSALARPKVSPRGSHTGLTASTRRLELRGPSSKRLFLPKKKTGLLTDQLQAEIQLVGFHSGKGE